MDFERSKTANILKWNLLQHNIYFYLLQHNIYFYLLQHIFIFIFCNIDLFHAFKFYSTIFFYLGCQYTYTGSSGTITQEQYSNNQDCVWKIETSKDKVIKMQMKYLEIENSAYCVKDYLLIKNGDLSSGEKLGKYCGNEYVPLPIISSSNILYLQLISDEETTGNGFSIKWEAVDKPLQTAGMLYRISPSPLLPTAK